MPLLDPQLLRDLDRLEIATRRVERGSGGGERLSSALGRSLDFAEHREYFPGDDLRLIDWNVYARQERFVVKQFDAEADLQLYLLIDQSESMNFGDPSKAYRARQIGAALAYVALAGLDRVHAFGYADRLIDARTDLRGRGQVARLCAFLERLPVGGRTDLAAAVREFCAGEPLPGMVVVCSDCWDLESLRDAVRMLRYHRHELVLVQVVTPEEVDPALAGDLELIDSETGDRLPVTASPRLLADYRTRVEQLQTLLRRYATRHGARFLPTTTHEPVADIVRRVLVVPGAAGRR